MYIFYFLTALSASAIGALSGIGGGIIIKPVMDAATDLTAQTISFMSGCTVLSMAVSSYIRGLKSSVKLDYKISTFLALGAAAGGYVGKAVFSAITSNITLIQSVILLFINIFVWVYLANKSRIKQKKVHSKVWCTVIGLILGGVSSFLGIGGGPINIVVLYYFFSMDAKTAGKNSLFIILFSQFVSLFSTIVTKTVPVFEPLALGLMCAGGVGGALVGSFLLKRMGNKAVEGFFLKVLIFLIVLNVYNIIKCAI